MTRLSERVLLRMAGTRSAARSFITIAQSGYKTRAVAQALYEYEYLSLREGHMLVIGCIFDGILMLRTNSKEVRYVYSRLMLDSVVPLISITYYPSSFTLSISG